MSSKKEIYYECDSTCLYAYKIRSKREYKKKK